MRFFVYFVLLFFMSTPIFCVTFHSGENCIGEEAVRVTTGELMRLSKEFKKKLGKKHIRGKRILRFNRIDKNRTFLTQNPESPEISRYPIVKEKKKKNNRSRKSKKVKKGRMQTRAPQRNGFIGRSFLGGTLNDSGSFPPDTMGAVGPEQFIVCINGLIRSFDKATGLEDDVLDIDPNDFFFPANTVRDAFDPRIRYDRFSQRWFMITINAVENPSNRIMFAVSDGPVITSNTNWDFFSINALTGIFYDYPTLGIDKHALYIGGKTFGDTSRSGESETRDSFAQREDVYVVKKSSLTSGGPIQFTRFGDLLNVRLRVGPHVTQGVDNFDDDATEGYFIAVDNFFFGRLVFYRVSNPGGTPSISDPIAITIPSTQFPIAVRHLGNNNGRNGRLDSIDDRLMCAHVRNKKLWTVHQVGVNNKGVSSSNVTLTRNGCRWYQFDVTPTTPVLIQSRTKYHKTSTNLESAKNYWMPSIMTSGQGHMAVGCSTAGTNRYADATTFGRLREDNLGTHRAAKRITKTIYAYNPPGDSGNFRYGGRRWGDYSYTSVDPTDDMTMWTIQEYCWRRNKWGVRVAKLKAPRPARPYLAVPFEILQGLSSVDVLIKGRKENRGREFYDPGPGFEKRMRAKVGGGVVVNSVTYVSPTSVMLNISTVNATPGTKFVKIYNPDGRSRRIRKIIKII